MLGVIASRHRQKEETRFVSTWNVATNNELVTLPISKLYEIDWGDGTTTTNQTTHTYASSGTYQIKIAGVVDDFRFLNSGDKDKIFSVDNWGGYLLTQSSFRGCSNLSSVPDDLIVNNIAYNSLFEACYSLVGSFDNWKTIGVLSLRNLFAGSIAMNMNSDFTSWDVSQVVTFNRVFNNCQKFNGDISTWDTSNGEDFERMFRNNFSFNQSLLNFNFTKAKTLNQFMQGKSSANYDYQYYDALLIKWDAQLDVPNMINKTVDMGTIKRSSASQTSYDSLVSKGLIISDGGLI